MSVSAPKNVQANLTYKRLIHFCQKNNITITNLSTLHLSPIAILTGPCIKNGCLNHFEKTYGELFTSSGYCITCAKLIQKPKKKLIL